MSNQSDNHQYDGIIEENNKMPTWWVWLFLCTIIFAFLYFLHYQVGDAETLQQEFVKQMAEIQKKQDAVGSHLLTDSHIADVAKDLAQVELGKTQFVQKCASCHGQNLEGLIGPNLTDHFWIHGGKSSEIATTVSNGVLTVGMPAWKGILKEEEVAQVVAFINSKLDSNPANAKAPQGVEVK